MGCLTCHSIGVEVRGQTGNQFSLYTRWSLGIELGSRGWLAAGAFGSSLDHAERARAAAGARGVSPARRAAEGPSPGGRRRTARGPGAERESRRPGSRSRGLAQRARISAASRGNYRPAPPPGLAGPGARGRGTRNHPGSAARPSRRPPARPAISQRAAGGGGGTAR